MCRQKAALLLVALLAGAGCAKHATTGQPLPADYRITQSVAILVEANRAATETAIALNKTAVIDDATTAQILGYTSTVARASKIALVILDGTATTAQKTAQIQAVFAQVTASAGIRNYLSAHQNDAAVKAAVAALQAVELLVESLVKGANS
jgi:type IV pilus biogenesis protein CpaD/CtpE